jgi:ribosomal protein L37AE/L43A
MWAVVAEVLGQELARARADEGRYSCELCHRDEGVRFADRRWACTDCARRLFRGLRREQARTTPAFVLQRNGRRQT